ncbi:putative g2-specific protein kinase nima protein [Rosellinia necatrix]|uniref:EKC/KEOPS complex subunit BUD32 n=1 Tax=Rosellinia necatrix TaxID=77044 RepID=A0A1S8A8K3_ROSNE|nr:putative g2-specific protein kinase nima protein [Rosellinia necatrix]
MGDATSETVDQERAMAEIIHRDLGAVFANTGLWELERLLGNGSYGVTVLLRDRNPLRVRGRHRRVVLKRPLLPHQGVEDFATEIAALRLMRSNAHHGQMIAGTHNIAEYRAGRSTTTAAARRVLRRVRAAFSNPPENVFRVLSVFEGPAILLEYIEGGNLLKIQKRAYERGIELPNRLLWSFYYCLVRACVGLAYPAFGLVGDPPVLETIRTDQHPLRMVHGDIAGRNVMLDKEDPDIPERRATTTRTASIQNLHFATEQIILLISRHRVHRRAVAYHGIRTFAAGVLPRAVRRGAEGGGNDGGGGGGGGVELVDPYPNLDPELRSLLVDAMRVDVTRRPSLRDMLWRTRRGAAKPAGAYPTRFWEEGDHSVRAVLQHLMYDVPE